MDALVLPIKNKRTMKYDFDKIIPRRGTNSYKWDSMPTDKDILPLWVADMDFRTAPAIIEVLDKLCQSR